MNARELLEKYKISIIIAVTVLVIVLAVYYTGKRSAIAKNTSKSLPTDIKDNKSLTSEEEKEVEQLAALLYNDMKGLNLTKDINLWDKFLYSTDRVFIGTYNYFNSKYGAGETLYQWVDKEYILNLTMNWTAYRGSILTRMKRLNLY